MDEGDRHRHFQRGEERHPAQRYVQRGSGRREDDLQVSIIDMAIDLTNMMQDIKASRIDFFLVRTPIRRPLGRLCRRALDKSKILSTSLTVNLKLPRERRVP